MSQFAFRRQPTPAGPDNPEPAELACCANYRASNVQPLRTTPHLAGVIHDSCPRMPVIPKSSVSQALFSRRPAIAHCFFAHGDQFLVGCGVYCHGGVEIGFGSATRDRVPATLHN